MLLLFDFSCLPPPLFLSSASRSDSPEISEVTGCFSHAACKTQLLSCIMLHEHRSLVPSSLVNGWAFWGFPFDTIHQYFFYFLFFCPCPTLFVSQPQPSCQDIMLAVNISANHRHICICTSCWRLYKRCYIMFTLHLNDLTFLSGGGGDGGGESFSRTVYESATGIVSTMLSDI